MKQCGDAELDKSRCQRIIERQNNRTGKHVAEKPEAQRYRFRQFADEIERKEYGMRLKETLQIVASAMLETHKDHEDKSGQGQGKSGDPVRRRRPHPEDTKPGRGENE